ncbi:MAG TPA: ketoacyl-ACP synthase III [Thermoanaerobaculia bacterium]|nr:ketoacyl-ACP synthase III [Thermoanaerobaculia bacterium]
MPRYASIVATGCHLPEREVTNEELRQRWPDAAVYLEKMEASTGIRRRYWAPEDQATSDLALAASRQALDAASRWPEEVDLIILGTDSPDFITPATSVVLQDKLGAKNAGTFDVGCACASFPTALATGAGLLASNPALKVILVVGAYLMHRLAAPDDPTNFFYGDGAGAAVLEAASEPGFINAAFQADGAYARHWGIFSGGTAEPASEASVREGRTQVRLLERYPPEVNHEGWPRLVRRLAREGGFELSDIDLLIFTQVRKPSIELVMEDLGLPLERAHTVMEDWGYTGSACVPMAFHDAREKGKARPGDLVVFIGSGVGYNQAGAAFRVR